MKNWKFLACVAIGVIFLTVATVYLMNKIEEKKFNKFLSDYSWDEETPSIQGEKW